MKKLTVRSIKDKIKNDPYYQLLNDLRLIDHEEFEARGLGMRHKIRAWDKNWTQSRYQTLKTNNRWRVNQAHRFENEYTIESDYFEFKVKLTVEVWDYNPPRDLQANIRIIADPKYLAYTHNCWSNEIPDYVDLLRSEDFALTEIKKRYFLSGLLEQLQHNKRLDKEEAIQRMKREIKARRKRQEYINKGIPVQDKEACLKSIERHLNIKAPTLEFAIDNVHKLGRQKEHTKIYQVDYYGLSSFDGGPDELAQEYYSRFKSEPGTMILP